MAQPFPGMQWAHQAPCGLAISPTSITLQHNVHVPQARLTAMPDPLLAP